jgi:acetylornithine/succinyldiaminopimelate/putrescine aminotransferase
LIPDVDFITFNNEEDLQKITTRTAGIIVESIQGGAGFIEPQHDFLAKVKKRCEEVGALLIVDEIQPGFGRTGKLFGYENYNVVPDVVIVGKGMAGGMPVGGFIANEKYMDLLSHDPKLGHITTFGGHPVIAAACLATLQEVLEKDYASQSLVKEKLFRSLLVHPLIEEVRGKGLMLAAMTRDPEITNQAIFKCQDKGLILFWLLFEGCALRITPPLTITEDEIRVGCALLLEALDEIQNESLGNS